MQTKIQALLQSRRFWIAVAGVLAVTTESLGVTTLNSDQIQNIVLLCASWIVGDSVRKTEVAQ
jgi:hypothetical protein